ELRPSRSRIRTFPPGMPGSRKPAMGKQSGKPLSSELVDRARPALLQQPRQRAVGEDPSAGLAARAVVGFILRVDDALNRRAADRAGLAVAPVHRHLLAEGGHLFRES